MVVSRETPSPLSGIITPPSELVSSLRPLLELFPLDTSSPAPSVEVRSLELLQTLFSIRQQKSAAWTVLVFPDPELAENAYRIGYNLSPDTWLYFPEHLSRSADVPGFSVQVDRYRSETLNRLKHSDSSPPAIIVTTETAADEPALAVPPEPEKEFLLRVGETVDREALLATLMRWGYDQQETAVNPRSFAIRGGILDLFLLYARMPVRIELFGHEIESIRWFNPASQRSVQEISQIDILPPPRNPEDDATPMISLEAWLEEREAAQTYSVSAIKTNPDRRYRVSPLETRSPGKEPVFIETQPVPEVNIYDLASDPQCLFKSVPQNHTLVIFVETETQMRLLSERLPREVSPHYIQAVLETGFSCPDLQLTCLSASEMSRQSPSMKARWDLDSTLHQAQQALTAQTDLTWNDYLVHRDFGIGRYKGLETLESRTAQQECIKIEYADDGVVYVPVEKFDRVHKQVATDEKTPKLSALGSQRWSNQKQRVRDSAREVVKELVDAYSTNNRPRGFQYVPEDELYRALVASFPYEETSDQLEAIRTVTDDMESSTPMDRVICGDVGFGKTEVALRAAMKAISSGKKVLFLTPTTILADQHYISTRERLEPLGARVALLSRFRTKKEQQQILERMVTGDLDLIVGTHRLLSEDVQFPALGLLIIDEEHRFGVRHKEKIKQLKSSVDVLILTATPIPRTLQQALFGVRDISKIETPPKTRKPIHTFVNYFQWKTIHQALTRELNRNGQVYFLHNDITALPFYVEKISSLFPDASVAMAQGQMKSRDLERIVLDFFNRKVDILVCTTIIESGLDVSNANTIIINDAHNFGLAQLYQIRGRVGRSHRQAFCYLLLPKGRKLSEDAFQRLKAIEQYTSLGSGYDIALRDLEIRGAGNLFGYKQSGHMAAVGFDLYCELLQEAVAETTGKSVTPAEPPKVTVRKNTLLADDYVPLVQDRLYFYQRLARADDPTTVNDIAAELADRFGPLPSAAQALIKTTQLRVLLTGSEVRTIQIEPRRVELKLIADTDTPDQWLNTITEHLQTKQVPYRFKPGRDQQLSLISTTVSMDQSWHTAQVFAELFSVIDPQ